MDWGNSDFIIAIIAISTAGWVLTSWIRAKHGYALEGEWGGTVTKQDPEADRKIALLTSENEKLHDMLGRLQERISVVERIVTDQPTRLATEIDNLRLGV
jgi:exonuclease VII large subunit